LNVNFNYYVFKKDLNLNTAIKELIEKATAILHSYGATEIYLFGSGRTNDFNLEHSDIDLAIRGIAPKNFYSAVGELMCSIGRNVDVIDLDSASDFGEYLIEHGELERVA
jgi:predicted nucleotidyltransferase